ncbi:MAG: DUF4404 family protein [Anaerolineae bacterium]|nr:DUF4404 family protein [Anaerolineae bacterium]
MEPDVRLTLERLHEHFDGVKMSEAAWQSQLDDVKESVRLALDQPEKHALTLVERLEQAVIELEEEHPLLATVIRDAITVLTQAGV